MLVSKGFIQPIFCLSGFCGLQEKQGKKGVSQRSSCHHAHGGAWSCLQELGQWEQFQRKTLPHQCGRKKRSREFSFGEKVKTLTSATSAAWWFKILPLSSRDLFQPCFSQIALSHVWGKWQPDFVLSGQKQEYKRWHEGVWWLRWQEPCALYPTRTISTGNFSNGFWLCCQKPQIHSKQWNKGLQNTEE